MKHRHFYLLIITATVLIVSFTYPGLFNNSPWSTFAASPDPYSEDYDGYLVVSDLDDRLDTAASNNISEYGVLSTPVIDISGMASQQEFGQLGVPQQWVNILGNVSDPDGIASTTYSLNGGAESTLSIGPDTRRLADDGDFNIEIDHNDLVDGSNDVVITATRQSGRNHSGNGDHRLYQRQRLAVTIFGRLEHS